MNLSPREKETAGYISKGLSNKEIAHEMKVSNNTVRNFVTGILNKWNLDNRTQIAVRYVTEGLKDYYEIRDLVDKIRKLAAGEVYK